MVKRNPHIGRSGHSRNFIMTPVSQNLDLQDFKMFRIREGSSPVIYMHDLDRINRKGHEIRVDNCTYTFISNILMYYT